MDESKEMPKYSFLRFSRYFCILLQDLYFFSNAAGVFTTVIASQASSKSFVLDLSRMRLTVEGI